MSGQLLYVSGNHSLATPVSLPVFDAPLPGINIDYVLTQDFECDADFFVAENLNTPHPDYPDFKLAHESDKKDILTGAVRWTRTYVKTPDSYSEPAGNYIYNFIGFVGPGLFNPVVLRDRFPKSVSLIVQRDFFLVGPSETYQTFEAIPRIPLQRYIAAGSTDLDVDFIADAGVYVAGPTNPSITQYRALITADVAADSFSLVVEDSTLTRWIGNVYMRETRRIKAQ